MELKVNDEVMLFDYVDRLQDHGTVLELKNNILKIYSYISTNVETYDFDEFDIKVTTGNNNAMKEYIEYINEEVYLEQTLNKQN